MRDQETTAATRDRAGHESLPRGEPSRLPRRRAALRARWRRLRDPLSLYLAVAAGSVIGGVLRASASAAVHALAGPSFPLGTLFVNVVGSFVIGFYATLTGPDGRAFVSARQRQFVMTGICGGFTTFSVFSLETFRLIESGRLPAAGMNIGISIVAWLAAVWLGHAIASRINRIGGN